ncbi:MAG: ATP synthase F1 subunit delta [Hespellia sp.]|nr:ATP synthase F1 subunit delta [Hespellia sp.]
MSKVTLEAINQAKVLYHLSEDRTVIESLEAVYHASPMLKKALECRIVPCRQKERVLDDIARKTALPEKIKNYLKIMCRYGQIDELDDAICSYYQIWDEKHNILRTNLIFAKTPEQSEIEKATSFLKKQYPEKEIDIQIKENPDILGGVLIQIGQKEYDWSYDGCLKQLESKLT